MLIGESKKTVECPFAKLFFKSYCEKLSKQNSEEKKHTE